jgi:hypothetical protein
MRQCLGLKGRPRLFAVVSLLNQHPSPRCTLDMSRVQRFIPAWGSIGEVFQALLEHLSRADLRAAGGLGQSDGRGLIEGDGCAAALLGLKASTLALA